NVVPHVHHRVFAVETDVGGEEFNVDQVAIHAQQLQRAARLFMYLPQIQARPLLHSLVEAGRNALDGRRADQLLGGGSAEDAHRRRIDESDLAAAVNPDRVGRQLHQGTVAQLTILQ